MLPQTQRAAAGRRRNRSARTSPSISIDQSAAPERPAAQPLDAGEDGGGTLQTVPAPLPVWLAAEPARIWVWLRLGRIAGSPLLSQVAECLDQRQGAKLLGGAP